MATSASYAINIDTEGRNTHEAHVSTASTEAKK